ncbi:Alpha/Beta hydrolase protein [Suillus fuscotomentosus]|uniref:Alpha/Beta hydrolase protein n=1 Tax=Suillus fuscotomentosus TaxID=1912939 RepID=A0AAD4HEU3_9AGAM|nr:Alpha/Beta hydrolase protein [Suillus fuscotomentosus]KAG1893907.1 Alpha/Beta hydrolase protein [Suillus fuscotomentosus]
MSPKSIETFQCFWNETTLDSQASGRPVSCYILSNLSLAPPTPIIFQLLIMPVTDNMASTTDERYPSWKECQNTIWLCKGRMMWFRNMYLPDPATLTEPDNSLIFASDALLAKVPPAFVSVCELDILWDEGLVYGEKLKSLGVKIEAKVYPGAPHQILGMDAALKVGKQQADDAIKAVGDAFKAA